MRSNEEVASLLESLLDKDPDVEHVAIAKESAAVLWLRCRDAGRIVLIARADFYAYSLTLDNRFWQLRYNEDLTPEEEEEELRSLVSVAIHYVRNGGVVRQSRFLRAPYVAVTLPDEVIRIYEPFGGAPHEASPWK